MAGVCVVVLIGIPGVGKTYLCNAVQQNFTTKNIEIKHISFDEYEELHPEFGYKELRKEVYAKVDYLLSEYCTTIMDKNKCIVLIDDNMYYRSMRRSVLNIARKYRTGFAQIYIESDIELAMTRNIGRASVVPEKVIRNIYDKLEPPSPVDNAWEEFSYTLSATTMDGCDQRILSDLWQMIIVAMNHPVDKQIVRDKVVDCQRNHDGLLHTADLLLRKCVAQHLKTTEDKENVSREMALKKKRILCQLKMSDKPPNYKDEDEFLNILCNMLKSLK